MPVARRLPAPRLSAAPGFEIGGSPCREPRLGRPARWLLQRPHSSTAAWMNRVDRRRLLRARWPTRRPRDFSHRRQLTFPTTPDTLITHHPRPRRSPTPCTGIGASGWTRRAPRRIPTSRGTPHCAIRESLLQISHLPQTSHSSAQTGFCSPFHRHLFTPLILPHLLIHSRTPPLSRHVHRSRIPRLRPPRAGDFLTAALPARPRPMSEQAIWPAA